MTDLNQMSATQLAPLDVTQCEPDQLVRWLYDCTDNFSSDQLTELIDGLVAQNELHDLSHVLSRRADIDSSRWLRGACVKGNVELARLLLDHLVKPESRCGQQAGVLAGALQATCRTAEDLACLALLLAHATEFEYTHSISVIDWDVVLAAIIRHGDCKLLQTILTHSSLQGSRSVAWSQHQRSALKQLRFHMFILLCRAAL